MPVRQTALHDSVRADVQTLWDYHDMRHELRPSGVGIGLGGHDLGVATFAAELFHSGVFPLIVSPEPIHPPRSSASREAKPSTIASTL
jgi:hypothetical protein